MSCICIVTLRIVGCVGISFVHFCPPPDAMVSETWLNLYIGSTRGSRTTPCRAPLIERLRRHGRDRRLVEDASRAGEGVATRTPWCSNDVPAERRSCRCSRSGSKTLCDFSSSRRCPSHPSAHRVSMRRSRSVMLPSMNVTRGWSRRCSIFSRPAPPVTM